jgi:hypothetical protein
VAIHARTKQRLTLAAQSLSGGELRNALACLLALHEETDNWIGAAAEGGLMQWSPPHKIGPSRIRPSFRSEILA